MGLVEYAEYGHVLCVAGSGESESVERVCSDTDPDTDQRRAVHVDHSSAHHRHAPTINTRAHTQRHAIRYDTRCYFNVRSNADLSKLNLLHGNDN